MRARNYDLLICEPNRAGAAGKEFDRPGYGVAAKSPDTRLFAQEEERQLGSPTYQVDLSNPGGLRSAVARMLDHRADAPLPT